jgi:hypothetical protein
MDIYETYYKFVETLCSSGDISRFKKEPKYTYMLEHVTISTGSKYLDLIKKLTPIDEKTIVSFCNQNDSIGNPNLQRYGNLNVSPTSLRYLFHSHLILTHLQTLKLDKIDIVELGGGYGGLCLAMYHLASKYMININSYTIIDLAPIIQFQKMYLDKANPSLSVKFIDASTFGSSLETSSTFLVSNYCFSEIAQSVRDQYIQKLLPKVSHGFMAWNAIPVFNFGFKLKIEDEYPNTGGPLNKYVYF